MISRISDPPRLPSWFKQSVPSGPLYTGVTAALKGLNLHTVCEEARCPNRTECWARGTLTFQILGDICTRSCGFCAEKRGKPGPADVLEPERLLNAIRALHLRHVVITAPARDDLADGGASIFAETVQRIHRQLPGVTVEVLTSDFRGNWAALETAFRARPDIFNHNLETVRRLTSQVRSVFTYDRSLEVLRRAGDEGLVTKSGLMVGLGESKEELLEAFNDLRFVNVRLLTVGQYLPPSRSHLPLDRYYTPGEFGQLEQDALGMGFERVFAAPLVRSSYRAGEMVLARG